MKNFIFQHFLKKADKKMTSELKALMGYLESPSYPPRDQGECIINFHKINEKRKAVRLLIEE